MKEKETMFSVIVDEVCWNHLREDRKYLEDFHGREFPLQDVIETALILLESEEDGVREFAWDCVWVDDQCTLCEYYHKMVKATSRPDCPRRLSPKWRQMPGEVIE